MKSEFDMIETIACLNGRVPDKRRRTKSTVTQPIFEMERTPWNEHTRLWPSNPRTDTLQ
jgi:hypothetical protein